MIAVARAAQRMQLEERQIVVRRKIFDGRMFRAATGQQQHATQQFGSQAQRDEIIHASHPRMLFW
jgi:hypothetical protein